MHKLSIEHKWPAIAVTYSDGESHFCRPFQWRGTGASVSFFISLIRAIKEEIAPLPSLSSFSSIVYISVLKETDNKEGEEDCSSFILSSSFSAVLRMTSFLLLSVVVLREESEQQDEGDLVKTQHIDYSLVKCRAVEI